MSERKIKKSELENVFDRFGYVSEESENGKCEVRDAD